MRRHWLAVLALALCVPASGQDERSARADQALEALRAAYNEDRQPPDVAGLKGLIDEDKYLQLKTLAEQINFVEAGEPRAPSDRAASTNPAHDQSLSHRDLLHQLEEKLDKVFKTPPRTAAMRAHYRRLDSLPELRRKVQRVCAVSERSSDCLTGAGPQPWCSFRKEIGPLLDQLLSNPRGPVVLPEGHPYSYRADPVIACALDADPRERQSREIESKLDDLLSGRVEPRKALEALGKAYEEAARLAGEAVREECLHGGSGKPCDDARKKRTLYAGMVEALGSARRCLDSPKECGGFACGLTSLCALPRAAGEYAMHPSADNLLELQAEALAATTLVLGPANIAARYPAKVLARAVLRARRMREEAERDARKSSVPSVRRRFAGKDVAAAVEHVLSKPRRVPKEGDLIAVNTGHVKQEFDKVAGVRVDQRYTRQNDRPFHDGMELVLYHAPGNKKFPLQPKTLYDEAAFKGREGLRLFLENKAVELMDKAPSFSKEVRSVYVHDKNGICWMLSLENGTLRTFGVATPYDIQQRRCLN